MGHLILHTEGERGLSAVSDTPIVDTTGADPRRPTTQTMGAKSNRWAEGEPSLFLDALKIDRLVLNSIFPLCRLTVHCNEESASHAGSTGAAGVALTEQPRGSNSS